MSEILVTGSAGHLGEGLVRTLRERGRAVVGIDVLDSPFTTAVGSVTDRGFVRECLAGVRTVLHVATLHKPHVGSHGRQDFVDTNVTGTLTLLEEAVAAGVERFVFTSTTSTFGRALSPADGQPAAWITEDVRPVPRNVYGVTKTAAEDLCELVHRDHGLPVVVLRTSRFFPEPDDRDEVRAAYDDLNLKVNEFLYRRVDLTDVVEAHLLAAEHAPRLGFDRFIVSATTPFTPDDVAALHTDAPSVVERLFPDHVEEYARRGWRMFDRIDRVYVNDRAREELGWTPRYDFRHVLDLLRADRDPVSPLARAVGVKGYHAESTGVVHGQMITMPLDDPAADLATAGGKGMSLARLARAGFPVPRGFHVTTAAYREFVTSTGLAQEITSALRGPDPAGVIAAAFAAHPLPDIVVEAVTAAYDGLGSSGLAGGSSTAVRSSATAEDLPHLSFAGQHDSFLNVSGVDGLLDAIRRCWASLWTERAIAYRDRNAVSHDDVAIAVVVQELVPAEVAGVLFTADPLSGARDRVVVDATWGLGEALVGGHVTPDNYLVGADAEILDRRIGDKTVRTVRTDGGTTEEPMPESLRREPVLDDERLRELAAIGRRIHELYGTRVDVEWALHNGRFAVLQARPVTSPEEWNDSRRGDYLWTSTNLGEAIPSVMTPMTWSVAQVLTMPPVGGHPVQGNIGGRFYLNLSASLAMAQALGLGSFALRMMERTMGRIPGGVTVPPLPMSRLALLRAALRAAGAVARQSATYRRRLPALLAETPAKCESIVERVRAATDTAALLALWESDVDSLLWDNCRILEAGARQSGPDKLGPALRALVGEADATLLTTGLHGDDELVSLGPVLGLAKLRRGETTREDYLRAWGHRCADEYELSAPRPREDPAWLDGQLAAEDGGDPDALLDRQATARAAAWRRFAQRHPGKVKRFRGRVDKAATAARKRELARSEMVRTFWALRAFLLRAGELTGHGDDVFFLTKEEVLVVLRGDEAPLAAVPARRTTYDRYRALPPYPRLIRGPFDPVAWAADPDRRTDLYDESAPAEPAASDLTGFPGAAGIVEGTARVVSTVEEGKALLAGEILVTSVTNIGWTPLFPRAAAVVTDIGAPLSHAAIVARELGIPAVVGCGTATTRIRTGDRVRVDGTRGTVTVIGADE